MAKLRKDAPRAYSYLRFSTPEQLKGDSLRRQTVLAREYAQRHGLTLDDSLTFKDLGVSAYQGRNVETGRLGAFLEAVRSGVVPQGSYLLVESLDRISRQHARRALRTLEDICDAGIIVVTLADSREYTRAALDSDPTALLMSILIFMRANEESTTKARRMKAAWKHKRASAADRKLTAICPSWLKRQKDREGFDVIAERAKVVRRIYADTLRGIGQHSIARNLNAERVPTFNGGQIWHRSYISKLLNSPAVIGTFIPHTQEHRNGRKVRTPEAGVPNYFPTIVRPETFHAVQSMRATTSPQRGKNSGQRVTHLLGGIAKCARCGSSMTVSNKGSGWRYYVCTKAKARAGCTYKAVPHDKVERAILEDYRTIINECPTPTEAGLKLDGQIQRIEANIEATEDSLAELLEALEGHPTKPAAVLQRIADHEASLVELRQQERALLAERESHSSHLIERKLDRLAELLSKGSRVDRHEANAALRQLVSKAVIDGETGEVTFEWHHGGESGVTYEWFKGRKKGRK